VTWKDEKGVGERGEDGPVRPVQELRELFGPVPQVGPSRTRQASRGKRVSQPGKDELSVAG